MFVVKSIVIQIINQSYQIDHQWSVHFLWSTKCTHCLTKYFIWYETQTASLNYFWLSIGLDDCGRYLNRLNGQVKTKEWSNKPGLSRCHGRTVNRSVWPKIKYCVLPLQWRTHWNCHDPKHFIDFLNQYFFFLLLDPKLTTCLNWQLNDSGFADSQQKIKQH